MNHINVPTLSEYLCHVSTIGYTARNTLSDFSGGSGGSSAFSANRRQNGIGILHKMTGGYPLSMQGNLSGALSRLL